ncbi:MAG: hypothetical protein ACREFD_14730 [Stellaceae bacterium]
MADDASYLEAELDRLCADLRHAPDEAMRDGLVKAIEEVARQMRTDGAIEAREPANDTERRTASAR